MDKVPLDWRLEQIPNDTETRPSPGPARSGRGSRSVSRRMLVVLLGVLLLLAAGVWLFTRLGWQRLRAQVEREIAYEDTQSRAERVDLVLAVQAPGLGPWRQLRASEVAAGLPAPLPAAGLLPTDLPAQIIQFDLAHDNVYAVLVRRSFADSAGQIYHFDLWQRYHSLAPGQWERLAPDETALAAMTTWTGRTLAARFPTSDQAVLTPALAQVDSALAQTCLDWDCPAGLTLQLTFTGALSDLSVLTPTVRANDQRLGPYPAVFDAALNSALAPTGLLLPAPHLAGLPADSAAAQVLVRGIMAQTLLYLANQLAGPSNRTADYVRDALAARAEIRLGLSPAPTGALSPGYFQPIEQLWSTARAAPNTLPEAEIANRLQTLGFLNFVLKSQPVAVEGTMLKHLRQNIELAPWLLDVFGDPGPSLIISWSQVAASQFAAVATPDWTSLSGLAMVCDDGLWMVHTGRLAQLLPHSGGIYLEWTALSPNGRRLGFMTWAVDGEFRAQVLDLNSSKLQSVGDVNAPYVLGWSADGNLVYLADEQVSTSAPIGLALWRYDPDTATSQRITTIADVGSNFEALWSWSPDHRTIALTRQFGATTSSSRQAPYLISVMDPPSTTALAPNGLNPIWSPDGHSVTYLEFRPMPGDGSTTSEVVAQYDLKSQAHTDLFTAASLGLGDEVFILGLRWAPDGSRLPFSVNVNGIGTHLFWLVPKGNQPQSIISVADNAALFPLGFSADSQYFAYEEFNQPGYVGQLMVLNPLNHQRDQYTLFTSVWSPAEHRLAFDNGAGVFVTDPATGSLTQITTKKCSQLNWYDLDRVVK